MVWGDTAFQGRAKRAADLSCMLGFASAYDLLPLAPHSDRNVSHISTWSKSSDPEKTQVKGSGLLPRDVQVPLTYPVITPQIYMQAGMLAAKGEADVARYELARKLVEIEGAKKHVSAGRAAAGVLHLDRARCWKFSGPRCMCVKWQGKGENESLCE